MHGLGSHCAKCLGRKDGLYPLYLSERSRVVVQGGIHDSSGRRLVQSGFSCHVLLVSAMLCHRCRDLLQAPGRAGPAPCSLDHGGWRSTTERHLLVQNQLKNHQVRTDPSRFISFSSVLASTYLHRFQ